MYAEFSYDLVSGQLPNEQVLAEIVKEFATKKNGKESPRHHCITT